MALYQFQRRDAAGQLTGERFEIIASMHTPPGLAIVLTPGVEPGWRKPVASDPPETIYERVWGTLQGIVKDKPRGATCHIGEELPISKTLPPATNDEIAGTVNIQGHQVYQLHDGTHADLRKRRIVDSHESAARHAAACGYTRES